MKKLFIQKNCKGLPPYFRPTRTKIWGQSFAIFLDEPLIQVFSYKKWTLGWGFPKRKYRSCFPWSVQMFSVIKLIFGGRVLIFSLVEILNPFEQHENPFYFAHCL